MRGVFEGFFVIGLFIELFFVGGKGGGTLLDSFGVSRKRQKMTLERIVQDFGWCNMFSSV